MAWIKKIATRLLLILFGFIIALIIAEGILRISGKKLPMWVKWYYIETDYGHDLNKNFWPPENQYVEGITYPIWTNELGCFDNSPKPGSKILLVGDSFTWGFAPFEDKWGTILEQKIKNSVLKCGVSNYGSKQSLIKAQKIITDLSSIKLIIYGYFINDLDDDFLFPHSTVIGGYLTNKVIIKNFNNGTKTIFTEEDLKQKFENYLKYGLEYKPSYTFIHRIKFWLKNKSVLFNLSREHIKKILFRFVSDSFLKKFLAFENVESGFNTSYPMLIFGIEKYHWINNALKEHLQNLKEFKNLTKEIIITLIPTREQVYPEILNCKDYRKFIDPTMISLVKSDEDLVKPQKIIREFLEKEKIPYIDYLPLLRFYADHRKKCFLDNKKDLYWSFDGHWNIKGNHLVGLLLARFLVKEGLIEVQNKNEILAEIENNLKTEFGKLPPDGLWQSAIYIPKK